MGVDFDQLTVSGTAALGGDLLVELIGGFSTSSADIFEILTATSLTGAFGNVADGARLDTLGGVGSFLVSYDGTTNAVVLSNFLLALIAGDMDCDGDVDFDDIDEFVLGLVDPQEYENQIGLPPEVKGDTDGDGDIDFDDIDNFVAILTSPSSAGIQTVPEPGTTRLSWIGVGLLILCSWRQRGRQH